MKLINIDLYARIKAYAFAKIFVLPSDEKAAAEASKRSAKDFIKYIKRCMPKDLRVDTTLVERELQIADLARRVKNFELRKLDFEMTLEETR